MIVTTTNILQGYEIVEYLGVVSTSEVYLKGALNRDDASWSGVIDKVVKGISKDATKLGADAIIGFSVFPEEGAARGLGTAVKIEKI